jgi:glycosyltransferase involved in cell wall biosynthesis
MDSKNKISVVIALYNSSRFIVEQLNSIIVQDRSVDEVILIDDNSTDNSVQVVSLYIEENHLKNWKLYRHEKNQGYISTFYDAINICTGDIIVLCDHDDLWFDNKISVIEVAFRENRNILALATSFTLIDENGCGIPVRLKRNHANNNLIRRKIKTGSLSKINFLDIAIYNLSPGCTCAFSKTLKLELLKYISCLSHDWAITTLASCKNGLYYLDKATTRYRIYSGNTIGLGHKLQYEHRKNTVIKNCDEKKEMLKIVENILGKSSHEYIYALKVEGFFNARKEFLCRGKILMGIRTFINSLPYGKLYESVAIDIVSVLKKKRINSCY